MATVMLLVYGWYFAVATSQVENEAFRIAGYQSVMLVAVVALVILAVAAHIAIAIADPKDADRTDVRDREINRYGEYVGGYVLGVGALCALAMAMFRVDQFWIANAILAAMVLSELVSSGTRIVLYRRGL